MERVTSGLNAISFPFTSVKVMMPEPPEEFRKSLLRA